MSKFCGQCGQAMLPNTNFCAYCGAKIAPLSSPPNSSAEEQKTAEALPLPDYLRQTVTQILPPLEDILWQAKRYRGKCPDGLKYIRNEIFVLGMGFALADGAISDDEGFEIYCIGIILDPKAKPSYLNKRAYGDIYRNTAKGSFVDYSLYLKKKPSALTI